MVTISVSVYLSMCVFVCVVRVCVICGRVYVLNDMSSCVCSSNCVLVHVCYWCVLCACAFYRLYECVSVSISVCVCVLVRVCVNIC